MRYILLLAALLLPAAEAAAKPLRFSAKTQNALVAACRQDLPRRMAGDYTNPPTAYHYGKICTCVIQHYRTHDDADPVGEADWKAVVKGFRNGTSDNPRAQGFLGTYLVALSEEDVKRCMLQIDRANAIIQTRPMY